MNNPNPQKELLNALEGSVMVASSLSSSTNVKDVILLGDIIRKLHKYRRQYPQYEKKISHAIFKIHDMAYYGSSDLMRQQAHVSALCGFLTIQSNDMSILAEVLNRMALVQDLKNIKTSFRPMINHILNVYQAQNYQQQDSGLKVAYRLKTLIQMMADIPGKKNISDNRWLHESATKLAQVHPRMKSFAEQFPPVKTKTMGIKDFRSLAEPVRVHTVSRYSRTTLRDD